MVAYYSFHNNIFSLGLGKGENGKECTGEEVEIVVMWDMCKTHTHEPKHMHT